MAAHGGDRNGAHGRRGADGDAAPCPDVVVLDIVLGADDSLERMPELFAGGARRCWSSPDSATRRCIAGR
jgi:hypothetical protein